jgi:hypothetical protein
MNFDNNPVWRRTYRETSRSPAMEPAPNSSMISRARVRACAGASVAERLPTLLKDELEDEDGNSELRDKWTWWAERVLGTGTMKEIQTEVVKLIKPRVDNDGRKLELALPLVQTAYYIGDGLHELILDDLVYLWNHQDIKYSLNERLLIDLHEIIGDQRNVQGNEFVPTTKLLPQLRMIEESPWLNYRNKELNAEGLAFLLAPFGVKPRLDWSIA